MPMAMTISVLWLWCTTTLSMMACACCICASGFKTNNNDFSQLASEAPPAVECYGRRQWRNTRPSSTNRWRKAAEACQGMRKMTASASARLGPKARKMHRPAATLGGVWHYGWIYWLMNFNTEGRIWPRKTMLAVQSIIVFFDSAIAVFSSAFNSAISDLDAS